MVYNFRDQNGILDKAIELLENNNLKTEFQNRKDRLLKEKIDVTKFMVWLIENYPESVTILKENPEFQYTFL